MTVKVTSERTEREVEILEDPVDRCALNRDAFAGEQEWKLHDFLSTFQAIRVDDNKSPKTTHNTFCAAGKASRRPNFFIWNVIVVMVTVIG